jgi:hypothetical protein
MIKTKIVKRPILMLTLVLSLAVAGLMVSLKAPSKSYAAYDVNFTNFWVGNVTPGSGHIGVDIWWPSNGSEYNPCHHSSDIYYGACALANNATASYYKVMNYSPSGNDFPYGIFVDNQNTNTCKTSSWCTNKLATSFNHGWGRIITDGSIEIYPHISGSYNPSSNTVGGVRIQSDFFLFANGGRYSKNIGDIILPELGKPGVGKMNGFVTNNGSPVANNRVLFEIFQRDSSMRTSTGIPMNGFSSVKNNGDAYYNTGALPSGSYKIYITDTQTGHKIILEGVNIFSQYERLDFKLEQRCFGFTSIPCTDPA